MDRASPQADQCSPREAGPPVGNLDAQPAQLGIERFDLKIGELYGQVRQPDAKSADLGSEFRTLGQSGLDDIPHPRFEIDPHDHEAGGAPEDQEDQQSQHPAP
jgi:hypothetical protein